MDNSNFSLTENKLFAPSVRLSIMILLLSHKKINFSELSKLLGLTPGNLDHHLKQLEKADYIKVYKKLSPLRKPLTMIRITKGGKVSFEKYLKNFRDSLNKISISTENNILKPE